MDTDSTDSCPHVVVVNSSTGPDSLSIQVSLVGNGSRPDYEGVPGRLEIGRHRKVNPIPSDQRPAAVSLIHPGARNGDRRPQRIIKAWF